MTAKIYNDGGDVPGTESQGRNANVTPGISPGWYGAFGLDWSLVKGESYWLAFEVKGGSNPFSGTLRTNASHPLDNEAYWASSNGYWSSADNLDLVVRIAGAPVPVPASVWILFSGLIGLVGIRQKRMKK